MKLMTKEIERKMPPLGATEKTAPEDKQVITKYFSPWSCWTWYVLEGEKKGNDWIFFGYVEGLDAEYGYFRLSELESVKGPFGLRIERDLYAPDRLPIGDHA